MTMNFIPDIGDQYYFATRVGVYPHIWRDDATDVRIARYTSVSPGTPEGRELANWQHALLKETPRFWEWVDDYELHT